MRGSFGSYRWQLNRQGRPCSRGRGQKKEGVRVKSRRGIDGGVRGEAVLESGGAEDGQQGGNRPEQGGGGIARRREANREK
jgi:hypothetical protein